MQHLFPLPCAHCNQPWAHIQNGCILIDSRHGGQTHTNTIALPRLHLLLSMSLQQEVQPLTCRFDGCGRPWGIIQKGRLFCYVWHSREAHQNTLSVTSLASLINAVAATV